jgi:hypothetical protein
VTTDPAEAGAAGPARRAAAKGFALSYPALALSYYRLRVSEIAPLSTTAAQSGGRQDQEAAEVGLRTLAFSQFGATVGQSLGDHFVIASTLKLVRAGMASGVGNAGDDGLSAAGDLEASAHTRSDIDLGAMVAYGSMRLGVAVKHVTEPEFGDGDERFEFTRQARAGFALVSSEVGRFDAVTAAIDIDLTKTATVRGDVRHLAFGLETWTGQRRLGLRTGLSIDTAGPTHTTGSVGGSFRGPYGVYVHGAWMFGSETVRNGWSTSLSLTF